jgi:hypothetical protein
MYGHMKVKTAYPCLYSLFNYIFMYVCMYLFTVKVGIRRCITYEEVDHLRSLDMSLYVPVESNQRPPTLFLKFNFNIIFPFRASNRCFSLVPINSFYVLFIFPTCATSIALPNFFILSIGYRKV